MRTLGWPLAVGAAAMLASLVLIPAGDRKRTAPPVGPASEPDARETSVRRPLPADAGEVYDVERKAETVDSQGTAFAVDRRGVWATAGHATLGCARVTLGAGGRESPPMASVLQGMDSDISLIFGTESTYAGLPLDEQPPPPGTIGYHMGFPSSRPTVIGSRLIGPARARSQDGNTEPLLAWSEIWRSPELGGGLGGLSGGPVIEENGRVAGVVSLVTDRRGRIFTVPPGAVHRLMARSTALSERAAAVPVSSPDNAVARFRRYISEGLIRQAFCKV